MFGKNAKVDLELNRDVEQLIKTGGKEKLLPIVQAGEPVLRQRTVAYNGQLSKRTLAKLIDTMHTTMLEAPGVGLAATQIGLGLALAVVEDHVRDDEDDPLDITAEWDDEDGKHHSEPLHGWPARIFQHETDHLSGELYIDRAEIRSLTTNENLEDYWCEDPVPTEAAEELGFAL